jgi:hypothetical protein
MKGDTPNTIWQIGRWTLFLIGICSFFFSCLGPFFGIEIEPELSFFLLLISIITIGGFIGSFRF